MARRHLRVLALVAAIAAVGLLLYGGRLPGFRGHNHQQASSERKVLYWYDAMDPSRHYDKPGKAPDGMDLVPKYADTPSTGERKILYWYDPMHPSYKSDKPGSAPDCGMDLVPKYADEASAPGAVSVRPDQQQLIGVRTAEVQREALVRTIRTSGQVMADESRIHHVHVKVAGFLEQVYANYVGQFVKKGQPLFTIYSPELVATEQEYLIAKRGQQQLGASPFIEVSQGADSLLRSARERLKLWDVSDAHIERLDKTGTPSRTMTIYSPVSGFVMDRKAFTHASVTPDTDIYSIADLSRVWVNADIYESEAPYVRVGQRADMQLSYYPGKAWQGRVAYIFPTLDPTTRTLKARIDFPNPGLQLKPQMFADVQLRIDYGNQIVVPQEAVLNSGTEQKVFVTRDGGSFEPRRIQIGPQIDGKVVVLSGLNEGETIVTSGNFLMDSESRLKGASDAMQH